MIHADDVIERVPIDGHTAERGFSDCHGDGARVAAFRHREDLGARRHDVADSSLAELHHAADDRDLVAPTDALQLTLAQEIPHRFLRGLDQRGRVVAHSHDRSAEGQHRCGHDLRRAQHRHAEGNERCRPSTGQRARDELTHKHNDERVRRQTHDRDVLMLGASPSDQHARQAENHRNRGVGGGKESLWPLEIQQYRRRAAQPALCPVPQPDATRRAYRHRAGGEPRDEDKADAERHLPDHSCSGNGTVRSKYTRSMRRRRTRSTTTRNPSICFDSPGCGTRPNAS